MNNQLISVTPSGQVTPINCNSIDPTTLRGLWQGVYLEPKEFFELDKYSVKCRMLKVRYNKEYTITRKADADINRENTALVAVSNKVFAIAGRVSDSRTVLSTVSCYDIAENTW